ncbi:MAG: DUF1573 domain-containing protein [Bacteroidetes bacterium]|nr:MAG: DUF1573 domain-containing protein [Bacteroidota bacterium]REK08007.1 MAG: DUF1573 domain-containing protein [Bacteroidota bacterium]REK32212.1 MAG: DUF1573 domain-containing protein [Bacteroidota bacterium]REK47364.1 MAG: DUF1573 domain-containing protein [Bacteroidota bacterium]
MKISKILTLTLIVAFTGLSSLLAQDSKPVADNPNAPEITFESDVYDYGTIKQGADGNSVFKFKNTGNEPLIISAAKASCGCTVPDYPKEPIMKNQTGIIKVHYDTKRVGAFTKTITINSNAKTETKILTIKGTVEATEEKTEQAMPLKNSSGSPLENSK